MPAVLYRMPGTSLRSFAQPTAFGTFTIVIGILTEFEKLSKSYYFESGWEKRFFTGVYKEQRFNIHVRLVDSKNAIFATKFVKYLENNDQARFAYMQFKERLAKAGITKEEYCLIKDSVLDLMSLQF